jgi:hypothetical protein
MDASRQPEQQFFPDPSVDRLMGVVFNLAAELQVMRERLRVLEHLLDERGVVRRDEIDGFNGSTAVEQAIAEDRREYVKHVLEPVLGLAASRNDVEANRAA